MTTETMPTEELTSPAHAPDHAANETPDWLIHAAHVRKKYCRDLRRSLWYGVRDVIDALTLRASAPLALREHEFWAIDDVSFELRPGDSLAVLGRNGAGKSTLLKLITGQRSLTSGSITTRGRIVALTELGLGFNPVLTGRENAYVNAAVHGISRRAFDAVIEDIIDFSGIREFIDSAVQTYSSGMKARLGFSVATHLNPDILIVDEVLAVGDLEFKRKCVQHLLGYLRQGGSMLLVAHEPYLIQSICNRCLVLDRGKIIFEGSGTEGVNFHFQLGHSRLHDAISEAAERSSEAPQAEAGEVPEGLPETALTAPPPRLSATPRQELTAERQVVIDSFEVLPETGNTLLAGRSALVVLHYRAARPMDVTWGFTLCTADLHTNIATCVNGIDGGTSRLHAGEHTLVCRLPDFPLQPGVYAIRGGVADGETQVAVAVLGYEDEPCFFKVAAAEVSRSSNFAMTKSDLVKITTEWLG